MGLASHLGPWLLGSIKNSTGGDPSNSRNMGATIVAQNRWFLPGALPEGPNFIYGLMFIPAGSEIIDYQVDVVAPVGGAGVTSAGLYLVSQQKLANISFASFVDLTTAGRSTSTVNVVAGLAPGAGVSTPGTFIDLYLNTPQFPANGFDPMLLNGGAIEGPGVGINYPPDLQENMDISLFVPVVGGPLDPSGGAGFINVTLIYQVRNPDGSYIPEYGSYYPNGPADYTGP